MAVPRNPIVIDTSDTFSTWLSNTNLAINVLKNIITDTVLTHPSASAFTVGSTITQATTGATGIVQVSTTESTTLSDLGTGTWGTSNNVTQSSPTSVTVSAGDIDAVTVSHLATTNAALTTPTLTTPTIASNMVVNGNTLTLPTSADTLVGRATTDTLTNKTITGATISGGSMSGIAITNNAITSAPTISVDDGGTIGTDTDADAITIAAAGAVTFSQRDIHTLGITVANGQTIGSASDADAITIASAGAVTFSQQSVHTLGLTSAGAVAITNSTANTSATDGALTVAGGLGVAGDATIGDDLRLKSDGSTLFFGANNEIELTHVLNDGLIIQNGGANTTTLWLRSSDTDVADGDILGEIKFRAPLEAAGSDAVLTAASIAARSEGDFSATNNATELVFKTGASEDAQIGAADGKMILSSAGKLDADNFACFFHYKFGLKAYTSGTTTGTELVASTSGTAYGNTTRFTSGYASDTLTVTFVKAGVYFASIQAGYSANHGNSDSGTTRLWVNLGGTSTVVRSGIIDAASSDQDMVIGIIGGDSKDSNQSGIGNAIFTATAGQTATFYPLVLFDNANAYSDMRYSVTIFG